LGSAKKQQNLHPFSRGPRAHPRDIGDDIAPRAKGQCTPEACGGLSALRVSSSKVSRRKTRPHMPSLRSAAVVAPMLQSSSSLPLHVRELCLQEWQYLFVLYIIIFFSIATDSFAVSCQFHQPPRTGRWQDASVQKQVALDVFRINTAVRARLDLRKADIFANVESSAPAWHISTSSAPAASVNLQRLYCDCPHWRCTIALSSAVRYAGFLVLLQCLLELSVQKDRRPPSHIL